MSQDEDLALFKAMMGDVQPLQNDTAQHTKKHQTTSAQLARRKAAVCLHEDSIDALSLDHAPELKPNDIIEFKKDGVQDGVYKKLRLGKYPTAIPAKFKVMQRCSSPKGMFSALERSGAIGPKLYKGRKCAELITPLSATSSVGQPSRNSLYLRSSTYLLSLALNVGTAVPVNRW